MVTEVVSAEEGEVISRTVPAEGAFYLNYPIRFTRLIVCIAGAAGVDFELHPTKVHPSQGETLPLCIYAIPCTRHRIRLYITDV